MAMNYKEYADCAESGGKLVTKKLKNGRYIHICYDKSGVPHATFFKKNKKDISKENDIIVKETNRKKHNKPIIRQQPKNVSAVAPTEKSIEELANYFSKTRLN